MGAVPRPYTPKIVYCHNGRNVLEWVGHGDPWPNHWLERMES